MKVVRINTTTEYDVCIANGLLSKVGELVLNVKGKCRAAIITDSNVDKLYADTVMQSLEKVGFEPVKYVFKAGEKSKNIKTLDNILEFLASNHITRKDVVVALGGGVVGDITGFASSCYLRGVDFVQVPTTLLAAVDSSVGGKTAIDLKAGKNLAGAFHNPVLVVCDTNTFKTLPQKEYSCGYAEVIKYAVCFDEEFFNVLENKSESIDEIVEKCVCFKRDVVTVDEFDNGQRKLLNFGHTAAHGIEKHSKYKLTHGNAVAVGMVIATRIAQKLGMADSTCRMRLEKVLQMYNLPTQYKIDAKTLAQEALSDKKRENDIITLVLPEKIGKCVLVKKDVCELENLFKSGLQNESERR